VAVETGVISLLRTIQQRFLRYPCIKHRYGILIQQPPLLSRT
jgi:hypothetical protein